MMMIAMCSRAGLHIYCLPPCLSGQVTDGFRLSFRRLEYESHNPWKDKERRDRVGGEEGLKHVRMLIKRHDGCEMR